MAAEPIEITVENRLETLSNQMEHLLADVHQIAQTVHRFATPEAQAMLDSLLSNPALKWKARRDGRKNNQ